MKTKTARTVILFALLALVRMPGALELVATPSGQVANVGDIVEVEIRLRNLGEAWLGGLFSVDYTDGLALIDYQYEDIGDPSLTEMPSKHEGNFRGLGGFSFAGMVDNSVLVRLWFRVESDGVHRITPSATGLFSAEWAHLIDFGTFVVPLYRGGVVVTAGQTEREVWTQEAKLLRASGARAPRGVVPVINIGFAPIDISAVRLEQGLRDGFLITEQNCTVGPLAPGAVCEVDVLLQDRDPLGGPIYDASLQIESNDQLNPLRKVEVTAAGGVGPLSLSRVLFDDVADGGTTYELFVVNRRDEATTIDALALESHYGLPSFDATIVRDECSGAMLEPAAVCYLNLRIFPLDDDVSQRFGRLSFQLAGNHPDYWIRLSVRAPTRRGLARKR